MPENARFGQIVSAETSVAIAHSQWDRDFVLRGVPPVYVAFHSAPQNKLNEQSHGGTPHRYAGFAPKKPAMTDDARRRSRLIFSNAR